MGILWASYGLPMCFLWASYGVPMCFLPAWPRSLASPRSPGRLLIIHPPARSQSLSEPLGLSQSFSEPLGASRTLSELLRAQPLAEFSPVRRAKRGPPPQAAYRAKRGSRRRRPAPKAPPSLARAANES